MKTTSTLLIATLAFSGIAQAGPNPGLKHVLCYTKASSWEHNIVHRDGPELSLVEKALQKLGEKNQIDFTFSKDGTVFTAENIAKFDAFFFYTSGDLTHEVRETMGRGDNYPLMPLAGKKAFLDAIDNGKGFIGCNEANYTFTDPVSPGEPRNATNTWRYTRMIGAGYMGHNAIQKGTFTYLDHSFPGMEKVPDNYNPFDQWYAFGRIMPDLHVVMAIDTSKLAGNLYQRPSYPVAWARLQGQGRVYYTTMGHMAAIWKDPVFLHMLVGGIRWAAGAVDGDASPNLAQVTPHAMEIPTHAGKYIADDPPAPNPHFPGYQIHIKFNPAEEPHGPGLKHALLYDKSAGYEHPIVYRGGTTPGFVERELLEFCRTNNIDLTVSKDGTVFTPENIAKFDAFIFYTSGDLINQTRNGCGDNNLLMTQAEKDAFLQAIHDGKGFLGLHSAIDTFNNTATSDFDASHLDPYGKMLGAASVGFDRVQPGHLIQLDSIFPGMENLPADFTSAEEWYAPKDFAPDLHVLLALDCSKMTGPLYARPNFPVVWARPEGKGRVYYSSLGHSQETWKTPAFRQMLLGALQWTTGTKDAVIPPTIEQATPHASDIPATATATKPVEQWQSAGN